MRTSVTLTLLPAFFALFLLASPAAAQVASVNLALIYNFHPLVQYYVPDEGYFLKMEEGTDFAARAEKQGSAIREAQKAIGELYRQLEKTQARRQEIEYNAWRDRRRIETDIQSSRDNPANAGKDLDFRAEEAKLAAIDAEEKKQQTALAAEEKTIIRQAIEWNDKLKSVNFHTGSAHQAMVDKIVAEVRELIRDVAKEKKCSIVLNASQLMAERRKRSDVAFPGVHQPVETKAPSSIYGPDNQEQVQTILSSHTDAESQEFARDALDRQVHGFQQMMQGADAYLLPFAENGVHDLLAAGGLDITAEVMNRLLLKYKVEPALVQLITVGIRSRKLY